MRKVFSCVAVVVIGAFIVCAPFLKQPFLLGESPIIRNEDVKRGGKKR